MKTNITPEDQRKYVELFFLSFLSLFIELFIIRLLSCDIRLFTVFKTMPLIACFLGLGLGFGYQKPDAIKQTSLALFMFILIIVFLDSQGIGLCGFPSAVNCQWQFLELNAFKYYLFYIPAILFGPVIVCYCIGSRLGQLFKDLPALNAYSVDLLGAITGSIIFSVLAYAQLPLYAMLILPMIIMVKYTINLKTKLGIASIISLILANILLTINIEPAFFPLALNPQNCKHETYWSPLQRIDTLSLAKFVNKQTDFNIPAVELGVNRGFYQLYSNDSLCLNNKSIFNNELNFQRQLKERFDTYRFPFCLLPHQNLNNVLIVGAGLGQNVLAGIDCNAKHIDAVEIDPVILELGKKYNPYYHNPKVRLINDDARHYINTTKEKYDLIIFGFLDSHAVAGQGSSVRLDCYVYTKESIEAAKRILNNDGIIFLNFVTIRSWMQDRLIATIRSALGNNLIILSANPKYRSMNDTSFIYSQNIPLSNIKIPQYFKLVQPKQIYFNHIILSDDYPFLYVEPDVIDWYYLLILAEIFILSLIGSFKIFIKKPEALNWQLFFLGAGFLLLELTTIARLALVYGTTWFTSSVVINGILIMIFLANLIVIKQRKLIENNQTIIYLLLLLSLILTKFIQIDEFLRNSPNYYLGSLVLLVIFVLPVLFAGLIFPIAFYRSKSPPIAFTYNLLGAMLGGVLEYLSFYYGNSGLVIVSAILYLISFGFYLRKS